MMEVEQKVFKYIEDMDKKISNAVNKNMCTLYCPCFQSTENYNAYIGSDKYDELFFNKFGRTKKNFADSQGNQPLKFSTLSFSFNNVMECYDFLKENQDNPSYSYYAKQFDFSSFDISPE